MRGLDVTYYTSVLVTQAQSPYSYYSQLYNAGRVSIGKSHKAVIRIWMVDNRMEFTLRGAELNQ